jgi:hypothetical protein
LCGGDVDFIYSKNAATDILYVTKSASNTDLQEDEKVILQVAGIPLENKYWSSLEADLLERARSSSMYAVTLPITGLVADGYTASNFNTVVQLSYQSLEESADQLGCKDLGTASTFKSSLRALRLLSGNMSHTDCSNIPWQWCSSSNYSQLRALCPMTCNCHYPSRYFWGLSGYFHSPAGGCPGQCESIVASFNELYHATNPLVEEQGYIACDDVDEAKLIFQGGCVDLDIFQGNSFDVDQYRCSQYTTRMVDLYNADIGNFTANGSCDGFDDSDWTASSMCCACGGGTTDVSTSASCAENLTDNCKNMNLEAFSLVVYLRGLFETLLATPGFEDAVTQIVKHKSNLIRVPDENKTALISWVISGNMSQSILSGSWEMLPGVPHPRGLKGCAFLTSFEITALLNTNLCSAETYASLKSLCPIACGCTPGTFYADDGSLPAESFDTLVSDALSNNLGATPFAVRAFTMKTEELAHCPASCVLPHPDYSGDTSYENWTDTPYYYND